MRQLMSNIVKQMLGGKIVRGKSFFAAIMAKASVKRRAASAERSGQLQHVF